MSTILAVTAVEVFLNLWFRVHATERGTNEIRDALVKDLEKRISLDQKLVQWPKRHLHTRLNLKAGPGKAFISLKSRRNSIIHFESSHETIHASNIIVHGLAETTEYDLLSARSAADALATAEELVAEVFRVAGFENEKLESALAAWIGKRESNLSVETTSHGVPPRLVGHVER